MQFDFSSYVSDYTIETAIAVVIIFYALAMLIATMIKGEAGRRGLNNLVIRTVRVSIGSIFIGIGHAFLSFGRWVTGKKKKESHGKNH